MNWTSSKLYTFVLPRIPLRKLKDNPQARRKQLKIIYLRRDLYPEYIEFLQFSNKKPNNPA